MAVRLVPREETSHCPILSVPKGDPTEKVSTRVSLSVEYVKVIGPSDREEDLCTIYGQICIWDGEKGSVPRVTLFDRTKDVAETIHLGNSMFQFLTLFDDDSARPLAGGYPVFVRMKLFQILSQGVDDRLIADADFEFQDDSYEVNKRSIFELEGKCGFAFHLAYSNIAYGASVEIQFTINKDLTTATATATTTAGEEEPTTGKGKRKHHTALIYGGIVAIQNIRKDVTPAIKLFYASSYYPIQVDIGSPIELNRKLVVNPTTGVLYISYQLYSAVTNQLIAENTIPFSIESDDFGYVRAPKNLTYKKQDEDGVISIFMAFIPFKLFHGQRFEDSSDKDEPILKV